MKKIILAGLISIMLFSCNRVDETFSSQVQNLDVSSSVLKNGNPRGVVASFTFNFASRKKNCVSGIGICELIAFGIKIVELPEQPKAAVIEETTEDGTSYFARFELPSEIDENEDSSFYIEEDIYAVDEEDNEYVIKAGDYEYIPSIGTYGGYIIEVEKI